MLRTWLVGALFALSLCAFVPSTAWAGSGTRLALDLDYVGGIDERGIGKGTGGALRFGQKMDLVAVNLTGEIGASYHMYGGEYDPTHYAGFVGGQLGFGKIIEPSVFLHVGVGRLNMEVAGEDFHDTGPMLDVGLALDFTLLPIIDVGVHAAYDFQRMDSGENFDWYRLGAHVALTF
jgi:hypothetical protein